MGLHSAGVLALLASTLALQAAEPNGARPGAAERPTFSVSQLRLGGATGRDKPGATFYVRAGKDPIKNLQLLPSDLTADDGSAIAPNLFAVAPTSVSAVEPGQAVLVNVTIGPVPTSGTYKGAIRLFYEGIATDADIQLPVEFKATSRTILDVAPHASPLVISRTGGTGEAEPAQFCVTQKADQDGSIVAAVAGPLEPLAPGSHPLPEGAATVKVVTQGAPPQNVEQSKPGAAAPNSARLSAGAWTTMQVELTNVRLEPGTYRGVVQLKPDGDSVQTVPIEVTVRDHWVWAFLVMLFGIALSYVATYMATTGSAQLQNLRRIDSLRKRLAPPRLLSSNDAANWLLQLDQLDVQGSNPAQVQARLDEIVTAITKAQAVSEERLKTLQSWATDRDRFNERSRTDEHLAALASSPWVSGLSERLDSLGRGIQEGTLPEGVVSQRLQDLEPELAQLKDLGEAVPRAREENEDGPLPSADELKQVEHADDPRLNALIAALRAKGVWPTAPQLPAAAPPSGLGFSPETRLHGTRPTAPGWPRDLAAWIRSPRGYLRMLSSILSLLAISLLVVTGLLALYANKPTFGSNWAVDYLGVFVWGLGSEAGRKQFGDIAPVLGALRTRLGLAATDPAPPAITTATPVTPIAAG